jgi:uncharacterized membrane protein
VQLFITTTGVFMSSWLGGMLLSVGEFIIKRLPLVKHIYSASKQVRDCHISSLLGRVLTKCCAADTSLQILAPIMWQLLMPTNVVQEP